MATLGLLFALTVVTAAQAAPPKHERSHQQVLPTGAEDAPAAQARAAAPSVKSAEALVEHSTRKDTVGLSSTVLSDGSISVNLDDRFHQVSRVVENPDGTTQVVCGGQPAPAQKAAPRKATRKAVRRAAAPEGR